MLNPKFIFPLLLLLLFFPASKSKTELDLETTSNNFIAKTGEFRFFARKIQMNSREKREIVVTTPEFSSTKAIQVSFIFKVNKHFQNF